MRDNLVMLPFSLVIVLLFGGWLFGWMFPTLFFILAIIVFFATGAVKGSVNKREWILALVLAIITYVFAIYTYKHLPIKDYRPYAVGKNIHEQMKSAQELGVEPTIYANIYQLKNSETGETMTMNSKDYLDKKIWENKAWSIESTGAEPIVIKSGYEPPIATFNVMDEEDNDIGEEILNDPNYSFIVVMYDITRRRSGHSADKLRELATEADKNGLNFFGMTSSPYEISETYRHDNQLQFTFYTADAIFLKTIIRSNPGLVLMKGGTIVAKWSASDIPDFETIQKKYMK